MVQRSDLVAWCVWALTAAVCGLNIAWFRGRVQTPPPTDLPSQISELLFLLLPLVFVSVGALVATRRRENPIGWVLCAGFASTAGYGFAAGYAWTGLVVSPGQLPFAHLAGWLSNWLWVPGLAAIVLTLLLFPDGRLPGPAWHPVVWGTLASFVLIGLSGALLPGPLNNIKSVANPLGWETVGPVAGVVWYLAGPLEMVSLAVGCVALALRFRRSRGAERQQLKWLAYAASFAPLAAVNSFVPLFGTWGLLVLWIVLYAIPAAIGLAILRYRLYDIDLLINRTLVYAALTACVLGVYILVVGYIGAVFHARGDAVSLLATGLVAVAFQPLRQRLQRAVNHLMFGQRDEPYAVLTRLGQRLEATLAPEGVLPTIVRTVAEALRLPYVAVALSGGTSGVVVCTGTPAGEPTRLPLVYQQEVVGELLLCPRTPGEALSHADRRLLEDLARQVGVAAHAAQLTAELQHSRERLVTTREEERRRLRRDLHDGLGPVLAGLTLQLDAARALVRQDPPAAEHLLGELKTQAQTAVADIRRLVYALRPPALDDLGLVPALRATAAQYEAVDGSPLITIEAPAALPTLPAAVEVAIYRITQEALANVVRHAQARSCEVRLRFDAAAGVVYLAVADDGRGVAGESCPGIGLHSMRERAEELGGLFTIDTQPSGGARVTARLPCKAELR